MAEAIKEKGMNHDMRSCVKLFRNFANSMLFLVLLTDFCLFFRDLVEQAVQLNFLFVPYAHGRNNKRFRFDRET